QRGSFKVNRRCVGTGLPAGLRKGHWIAAVGCIDSTGGTGLRYWVFVRAIPPIQPNPPSTRGGVCIYTTNFPALAVLTFRRLRSVVGRRTGRGAPPYDRYSARDAVRSPAAEKVVTLPSRNADAGPKPADVADRGERWKGIAQPGSPIASGLDAIVAEDKTF